MLAYIIKLLLGSGIMYLYYLLFLRNKKFHRYNRFYLLAIVVLSFLIPLISFDFFVQSDNARINKLLEILDARKSADTVIIIVGETTREIPWKIIGYITAAMVSITMLVLVYLRIIKVINLKRKYPIEQIQDIAFINTPLQEAPFSFFKNLFWREDILLNDETGQQIMRHEMAHIRQNHSWDRVFLQVIKALCWFNPVFYLIEKEITLIHEYIADEEAINNKDGRAFAAMLLRSKIENFGYAPGQAIFYSSIKKRLQMLTDHQKTKFTYARKLLVLPLLGCVTFAFGFKVHQAEVKETIQQLETQVSVQNTQSPLDTLSPLKGVVKGISIKNSTDTNKMEAITVVGYGQVKTEDTNKVVMEKSPLIIIDGKVTNKKDLQSLKSDDIEAINVLKDNHAISLYGEAGKNGVLLITTKQESQKSDSLQIKIKEVTLKGDHVTLQKDLGIKDFKGIYLLDGKEISAEDLQKMKNDSISAIKVYKNQPAIEKYGDKGKNGVIEIISKDENKVEKKD